MPASSWKVLWAILALLAVFLEGVALGRPETGDTLTETVRVLRYDPVARYPLVVLWVWLTWHFMIRPQSTTSFSWRDLVAVAIGVLVAIAETSFRHR
jgi:hypothetical protein